MTEISMELVLGLLVIVRNSSTLIQANSIYSVLKDEMNNYTNIKSTRALVSMTSRYSICTKQKLHITQQVKE